jgi:uncharacterized protein YcfJ
MKLTTCLIAGSSMLLTSVVSAEQAYHYDYATVLEARPVTQLVDRTDYRRECKPTVVRYEKRQRSSGDQFVGSVVGAAIGHALGHRSKHRTGATIAGALIGNSIAKNSSAHVRTEERLENHCQMIPVTWQQEQVIGYQVVYRYNGRTFEARLPYDPGDSLKLRVLINPMPMDSGSSQRPEFHSHSDSEEVILPDEGDNR